MTLAAIVITAVVAYVVGARGVLLALVVVVGFFPVYVAMILTIGSRLRPTLLLAE